MNGNDPWLADLLARYEREGDQQILQEALERITAAAGSQGDEGVEDDDAADRREMARLLQLFAVLDQAIDPAWDPEDVPVTGISPPASGGVKYPSGVDPAAIPDPEVRAEYERMLAASKRHAERYLRQQELRRIDQRAMDAAREWLAERYSRGPADHEAFEDMLSSYHVSPERARRLRALLSH